MKIYSIKGNLTNPKFREAIPDYLICLLRNLYAGQQARVRTRHGTMDWFKIGKEYFKAVYCHPAYLYAEYIMQNARLDEAKARIKKKHVHGSEESI